MPNRIGFYICHCGINIAYRVRVEEVAAFIGKLPDVVVSRDYKFMCSDPGQEMIESDIRQYGLNRVVVASCSPRLHEKTFQSACQRAGLNPYRFQMASVREQVSWVTADEDEATQKAKTLAAAAINRVQFHEHLETRKVSVHPDILVVGGGIAGMQAALDIGAAGHKAILVEQAPTIGGHMLQFDKTFPTLDCAACIGTPKMVSVAQDPNIELLTYATVSEVSGYIGNFTVTVTRKPRYVKEGLCTGCGECANVCPVVRPSEWDMGLGQRKAIYRSFPQAVPITYVIDKKGTAPCKATCPAHVSIQGFIALLNQGKYRQAWDLFRKDHPFPGICGRVCHHPCESACTRGDKDQPLAIRHLHRFLADVVMDHGLEVPIHKPEQREEKVAIIGSGPAGLSAAYFCALNGYRVTVFEKLPVIGGMMAVGIPEYRLPRKVLQQEIESIQALGVEIRTNVTFGKDITWETLEAEGYGAVFLGLGLHGPLRPGISGDDLKGVVQGTSFLRDVALGRQVHVGRQVVIIGGGNVAMDCARTCVRLGAQQVQVVYRRSREEMPAWDVEVAEAETEGVLFQFLTAPKRFIGADGGVCAMEYLKMELGPPDDSGRRRPIPIEGSESIMDTDQVILAIGQAPEPDLLARIGLETDARGLICMDPVTLATSRKGVFAGGDGIYGPKTVVDAVASGKQAAESIHRFLNHMDLATDRNTDLSYVKPELDGQPTIPRVPARHLKPETWLNNFSEKELGFNEDESRQEASRCLECGTCCECYQCVEACERNAIDHTMQPEQRQFQVGSIILATGFDLMDPSPMKQFGYGKYPNVYTSLEFERLSNATGPTGGQIRIRDDQGQFTRIPKQVALVHCVGSRDVNYHEYCSRVCCMYALKYSHLLKEKVGHDTRVYDFFIDQRCYGKGYEEFYKRCQEEGTVFIRGKVAEITDDAQTPEEQGKLIAIAEDTLLGRLVRIPVDMVILCAAMEARTNARDVGRIFGVNQGADGFFLEEHPKLGPLNTATDGIFLAGTCQGPKDIPDTVAQASGAASKALSMATRGQVEIPSTISWIDPDVCAGCQMCIGLCAYHAIEFDPRRQVSVVNEALCKGCGSCSGVCPSGAAQVRHFKKKQIFAEFDGLMDALHAVGM